MRERLGRTPPTLLSDGWKEVRNRPGNVCQLCLRNLIQLKKLACESVRVCVNGSECEWGCVEYGGGIEGVVAKLSGHVLCPEEDG